MSTYTIKFATTDDLALFNIVAVNATLNTWSIAGNKVSLFPTGSNIVVSGNAGGGNGTYTVLSATYAGGNTIISVTEDVPVAATVSGGIADPRRKPGFLIEPGAVDSVTTSLTLPGEGKLNYGEFMDRNLVLILENFARSLPPTNPTIGQTWFNTLDDHLRVFVGELSPYSETEFPGWASITRGVPSGLDFPSDPKIGDIYLKLPEGVLNYWTGAAWSAIYDSALVASDLIMKSGDTMTGPLILNGDPTTANEAATKHYVDTVAAGNALGFLEYLDSSDGQTDFTLLQNTYAIGSGQLSVYIDGIWQHPNTVTEISNTTFRLSAPVLASNNVLAVITTAAKVNVIADITLTGPTSSLTPGLTYQWIITNLDSFSTYEITTNQGVANYTNGYFNVTLPSAGSALPVLEMTLKRNGQPRFIKISVTV